MSKLKNFILPTSDINEMVYSGNIGFEEMVKFYRNASDFDISHMEEIINRGDWGEFKKLIHQVTGKILK